LGSVGSDLTDFFFKKLWRGCNANWNLQGRLSKIILYASKPTKYGQSEMTI